jgi:hypothetical protein
MIRPFPKPPYTRPNPERLPMRKRMTLIGALRCLEGVVLLADGQETITDYAKWAVNKIKSAEINQTLRVVMAGAGDADAIDMIWEKASHMWGSSGSDWMSGFIAGVEARPPVEWRKLIADVTREIVKKCDANVGLIWAVQDISGAAQSAHCPFELFRTGGLFENKISRFYFDGNPMLLARYLSDLYLKNTMWGLGEARAFAAYLLWEAKEYDPTVGKQSDIITLNRNGHASRMTYEELSYWEDHFRVLKREMSFIPIFSCATAVTRENYNTQDRVGRFVLALKSLVNEQEKMRLGKRRNRPIDETLVPQIRKHAIRAHGKAVKVTAMPSTSQKSELGP